MLLLQILCWHLINWDFQIAAVFSINLSKIASKILSVEIKYCGEE